MAIDGGWKPIDRKAGRLKRMQRGVLTFANIAQRVYPMRKAWMLTLTYREDGMWKPEHVSDLVRTFRKWCDRQGTSLVYEWVMELTKRGRPHFHMVVWLPTGLTCPKVDDAGWWTFGMSNREAAKFAPGYLAKYVSKGVDQWSSDATVLMPKGARMHGHGGLKGIALTELRWWLMPRWMRETVPYLGEAKKTKGGWLCRITGEFFPTPFEVPFSRGMAWFRRKSPEPCKSHGTTPTSAAANQSSFATCAWA